MHYGLRRDASAMSRSALFLILAVVALTVLLGWSARADGQSEITCAGRPATIVGSEGRDTLAGTSGRDVIAALGGNDRVSAGPGDDVVCLGAGNDALNGGAGDDLSVAEAVLDGDDSFVGGSGVDTARYSGRTAPVAVSLDNVPDDGSGDEADNVHVDVENVVGGFAGNTLRGSAADNRLLGGGVIDVINGGAGADILYGAGGNDIFAGDAGDDSVYGGAGDDRSDADAGADGDDLFAGGSGHDTASYASRTTEVRVNLNGAPNDGSPLFGEGDNLGGEANDVEHVIGGSAADRFNIRVFFGGAHLEGRGGNDGITSTNNNVDKVDGGAGLDGCLTDPIDIRISCER